MLGDSYMNWVSYQLKCACTSKILHCICVIVDSDDFMYTFQANFLVNCFLFNLDGRKPFPIVHGKTSEDTLLEVRPHRIKRTIAIKNISEVEF